MKDKIIDIIAEICEDDYIKNNAEIDLLENEILDSLTFVELISALEEEFDIEIQPTQVDPDTWRKIDSIVDLVKVHQKNK